MSAVPKTRKLTVEEYFAIEETSDRKHEFFDGEMFLMAGGNREHNIIVRNLSGRVFMALLGHKCQLFFTDQRLKVDKTGLYTYPDLLIVCEKPKYAPENRDTLINPRVVIEVLSKSTEKYDRTTKFRNYKTLKTVKQYLLVSQDEPLVEIFTRTSGGWQQSEVIGLDRDLKIASVPLTLKMADIYDAVDFPPHLARHLDDES